jgi:hypothetical protein
MQTSGRAGVRSVWRAPTSLTPRCRQMSAVTAATTATTSHRIAAGTGCSGFSPVAGVYRAKRMTLAGYPCSTT